MHVVTLFQRFPYFNGDIQYMKLGLISIIFHTLYLIFSLEIKFVYLKLLYTCSNNYKIVLAKKEQCQHLVA